MLNATSFLYLFDLIALTMMRVRGHMLEHRWTGRNKRLSERVAIKGKGKEFNQFLHTHKHYNSLVNILRLSRWTTSAMEAEKKNTWRWWRWSERKRIKTARKKIYIYNIRQSGQTTNQRWLQLADNNYTLYLTKFRSNCYVVQHMKINAANVLIIMNDAIKPLELKDNRNESVRIIW